MAVLKIHLVLDGPLLEQCETSDNATKKLYLLPFQLLLGTMCLEVTHLFLIIILKVAQFNFNLAQLLCLL